MAAQMSAPAAAEPHVITTRPSVPTLAPIAARRTRGGRRRRVRTGTSPCPHPAAARVPGMTARRLKAASAATPATRPDARTTTAAGTRSTVARPNSPTAGRSATMIPTATATTTAAMVAGICAAMTT